MKFSAKFNRDNGATATVIVSFISVDDTIKWTVESQVQRYWLEAVIPGEKASDTEIRETKLAYVRKIQQSIQ